MDVKQNNNDISMLKITRREGEAFFIGDVCIRVDAIGFGSSRLLIDEKCAVVEYKNSLKIAENIRLILSKNTSRQLKVKILAPRSVPIFREEIAQFDKNNKLIRMWK